MSSFFNCSDFLNPYCCKMCNLSLTSKVQYQSHVCGSQAKSEVIYWKKLCDKCSVISSCSMLWIFSRQMKHDKAENYTLNILNGSKLSQCDPSKWCKYDQYNNRSKSRRKVQQRCNKSRHAKEKRKYFCGYCDFSTYKRLSLKRHVQRKHTSDYVEDWYYCNECSYRGKLQRLLRKHIETAHEPKAQNQQIVWFRCNFCKFMSSSDTLFVHHMKRKKHFTEKPNVNFQCNECSYETPTKINLKRHILIKHTSDHLIYWHNCQFCEFKTKWNGCLKTHMKLKHSYNSTLNCFICPTCRKLFKNNDSLKRHVTSHTLSSVNCVDCKYEAGDFIDFRKHLKEKHLRIGKQYECEKCLFETDFENNLEIHVKEKH